MPRYIIKLHDKKENKDYYLEWSTVVDAPVTYGQSLEDFKEYYKQANGTNSMAELEERLKRVEEKGISGIAPFDDLEAEISRNRAGENETSLDLDGILERYCRNHLAG
jgi:hypothetical protein